MSKKQSPRGMNADEQRAQSVFHRMGFEKVAYEPDGNIPPDFLLDGRIAVEVRRLNQNIAYPNGKTRGQDECFRSLWDGMHDLLKDMGESDGESWSVSFTFRHPVERWSALKPKIRTALAGFKAQSVRRDSVIHDTEHFAVDVAKASAVHPCFFVPGCIQDLDSGGALVAEIIRNTEICSEEKLAKIAKQEPEYPKARHPEWWLVLVSQFGLKLDDLDKQQLKAHFKCPEGWDKLVIVNVSPDDWIEFDSHPADPDLCIQTAAATR